MERQEQPSYRSRTISKLINDRSSRQAYLRAKLSQFLPSQIRALRLRNEWTQKELSEASGMRQPRVSAMEKPGGAAFTVDTLIKLAAAFKVGLVIRFVPHSEMFAWESNYSQDDFDPTPLPEDQAFLNPQPISNTIIQ